MKKITVLLSLILLMLSAPVMAKSQRATSACMPAGCSSQFCLDTEEAESFVSTCEWKEEYGCYQKHGTCERQPDGQCGWTLTDNLRQCLSTAKGGSLQSEGQ